MQKSVPFFSTILIKLFDLISKSSCIALYGEPDYPKELLK